MNAVWLISASNSRRRACMVRLQSTRALTRLYDPGPCGVAQLRSQEPGGGPSGVWIPPRAQSTA